MSTAAWVVFAVAWVALFVAGFAGVWKTFAKAGVPGWGALVPLYNYYLLWKLAAARRRVLVGLFVPVVSLFAFVYICVRIAHGFGRSTAFGIGLALLGPPLWIVLGFGRAEWIGSRPDPSA